MWRTTRGHNIFVFEPGTNTPRVYFRSDTFNQPNDMTLARDGTIYASDPNFKRRSGQVWRIARTADGSGRGEVMMPERRLTTVNGIDLSPDEKTLYVAESETREIWAYRIDGARLNAPRLVKKFSDFSLDGIRTDIDGRIYVARILKGTIEVLTPDGKTVREIGLKGKEPTNLAFGGPDGKDRLRHAASGRLHRDVPRRPAGPRVLPVARAERPGMPVNAGRPKPPRIACDPPSAEQVLRDARPLVDEVARSPRAGRAGG